MEHKLDLNAYPKSIAMYTMNMEHEIQILRSRLEAAEAYIQAMEEFDAISGQPEHFAFKPEYDELVNKCIEKCKNTREALERVKLNV